MSMTVGECLHARIADTEAIIAGWLVVLRSLAEAGRVNRQTGVSMIDHMQYLADDRDSGRWGLRLIAGGTACIPAGRPYPLPEHPESHLFRWERGRVLREYQFVVIAGGGGVYEDHSGTRTVRSGEGFLLVPGRWHRYRPDPATGWIERWLAFDGPVMRDLQRQERLPAMPIVSQSVLDTIWRNRFDEILTMLRQQTPAWRSESEALLASLMARLTAMGAPDEADPVQRSAMRLTTELQVPIESLALEAGLSASQFRLRFQGLHGCSPRIFRQRALVARAQRLLVIPGTTVAEVAAALGFTDQAHFSRGFRRGCGQSPQAWRAKIGTEDAT